jgi:uncharacterized protein with von Willebrand factor type A (vWA) domain
MTLPRPLAPFLSFAQALRGAGHLAAPEQTQTFIAAVGLVGPSSLMDIRRAAHATFGPPPERREEFDVLFDEIFLGRVLTAPAPGDPEEMPNAFDAGAFEQIAVPEDEEPSGADASIAERVFARRFAGDEAAELLAFSRRLPHVLPRRRARRMTRGKDRRIDPARTFRQMLRRDGEVSRLMRRTRKQRQRRVLLLIDISGSMKSGTEGALRLAHALVHAGDAVEVFTIGTRLTRVTRPLARRNREQALMLASGLVADWDGGTRLGEALKVFLSVPRFAGFARGAFTIVLSDGLERGGPEALVHAMRRLDGLAWSVLWLTPLASDAQFQPRTEALRAIAPMIDRLGNGSDPQAVAQEILQFAKGARR